MNSVLNCSVSATGIEDWRGERKVASAGHSTSSDGEEEKQKKRRVNRGSI